MDIISLLSHLAPYHFVESNGQEVSYVLTSFLGSLCSNQSFLENLGGSRDRCSRMSIVRSLEARSVVSPQRPPRNASLGALHWRLQVFLLLCRTTLSGQIDHMNVYKPNGIMHGIVSGSKVCVCNKEKYDRRNALCLRNLMNHYFGNTAQSLPQSCAAVSASPKFVIATTTQVWFIIGYRQSETNLLNCDRRAISNATCGIGTGCAVILPAGCL